MTLNPEKRPIPATYQVIIVATVLGLGWAGWTLNGMAQDTRYMAEQERNRQAERESAILEMQLNAARIERERQERIALQQVEAERAERQRQEQAERVHVWMTQLCTERREGYERSCESMGY